MRERDLREKKSFILDVFISNMNYLNKYQKFFSIRLKLMKIGIGHEKSCIVKQPEINYNVLKCCYNFKYI